MGTRREKRGVGSGGLTVWSGNKTSLVRNDHRGEVVSNPLILANHSSTVGVPACLPQEHKRRADDPFFFFQALTGNWRREKGNFEVQSLLREEMRSIGGSFFPACESGETESCLPLPPLRRGSLRRMTGLSLPLSLSSHPPPLPPQAFFLLLSLWKIEEQTERGRRENGGGPIAYLSPLFVTNKPGSEK